MPRFKDTHTGVYAPLIVGATLGLAIITTLGLLYSVGSRSCGDYAEITRRSTEFRLFAGCFVQDSDGTWFHRSEYRAVVTAREGFRSLSEKGE